MYQLVTDDRPRQPDDRASRSTSRTSARGAPTGSRCCSAGSSCAASTAGSPTRSRAAPGSTTRRWTTTGYHLYDFDQTHILTVIASYQTEHNWTFGTRAALHERRSLHAVRQRDLQRQQRQLRVHRREPGHRAGAAVLPGRRPHRPPLRLRQVELHRLPRRPERHQPRQPRGAVPELQLPGLLDLDRAPDLPHARPEGRVLKRSPALRRLAARALARRSAWRRCVSGSTATIRS